YKIPDGRHRVVRTGRGRRSLAQVKVDPQDIGTVRGCEIPRAKIEPGVGRGAGGAVTHGGRVPARPTDAAVELSIQTTVIGGLKASPSSEEDERDMKKGA